MNSVRRKFESTATGREVDLIKDFAKDLLDQLDSDWSLVESSFGYPAAVLHIPTNTTYHMDADATARLNSRGDLKVVFSEQPNSTGSSYSSGSCYTDEIDRAVQLLKYNARRMEKWLEKHPYESLEYNKKLERRISRLERAMNHGSVKNEAADEVANAVYRAADSIKQIVNDLCKTLAHNDISNYREVNLALKVCKDSFSREANDRFNSIFEDRENGKEF